MKLPSSLTSFAIAVLGVICTAIACTTQNPAYTAPIAGQPDTNTAPRFIPDPRISQYSNTVNSIADGIAPANPYAGITKFALNGFFTVLGLVSGAIAGSKNKQKVVDTMAAGAVKAGSAVAQALIDHASTTPHFAAVADAINEHTGANQTLTGAPKTG